MKKTYIAPETELIVTHSESLLQELSGTKGTDVTGGGTDVPPIGDNDEEAGARQHNNWMWDTMEDDF